MNKRVFLFAVIIIGFFYSGKTQQIWTLDDCIAYAMEHNIDLQKVDLNNQRNEENYKQSIRNLLPSIYTSVGFRPDFGKSIDPNTNDIIYDPHFSNTYSAGTSIDIFKGFTRINRINYTKTVFEAGLFDEKAFTRALSFSIMEAFYNALFFKRYIEISDELIRESEWNKKFIEGMIRNGLKAESDILSVEAELASAELSAIRARNDFDQALLKLKHLINLNENQDLIISDDNLDIEKVILNHDVESLYSNALNNYPSILSSEASVITSGLSLKNAQAYIYPTFGLGGGISTGFYQTNKNSEGKILPFDEQFSNNANQWLSVYIGIPLSFNKGANRSQVKLAGISLRESELNLQKEKQALYQNIQQDLQKLNALDKEIEQGKKQVKAREAAEKIIRKKFEKGLTNQYELSQARNLLSLAKSNLLRTKIQFEIARRTVEYYKEII